MEPPSTREEVARLIRALRSAKSRIDCNLSKRDVRESQQRICELIEALSHDTVQAYLERHPEEFVTPEEWEPQTEEQAVKAVSKGRAVVNQLTDQVRALQSKARDGEHRESEALRETYLHKDLQLKQAREKLAKREAQLARFRAQNRSRRARARPLRSASSA